MQHWMMKTIAIKSCWERPNLNTHMLLAEEKVNYRMILCICVLNHFSFIKQMEVHSWREMKTQWYSINWAPGSLKIGRKINLPRGRGRLWASFRSKFTTFWRFIKNRIFRRWTRSTYCNSGMSQLVLLVCNKVNCL